MHTDYTAVLRAFFNYYLPTWKLHMIVFEINCPRTEYAIYCYNTRYYRGCNERCTNWDYELSSTPFILCNNNKHCIDNIIFILLNERIMQFFHLIGQQICNRFRCFGKFITDTYNVVYGFKYSVYCEVIVQLFISYLIVRFVCFVLYTWFEVNKRNKNQI